MSWHYAAGRTTEPDGEEWYEVHEVYTRPNVHQIITERGVRAGGHSVKELLDDLRTMLRDIQHYGVVEIGERSEEEE